MISATTVFVIFAVSLVIYYLSKPSHKGKLPPGPKGLPIIGNAHQLGKQMHLTYAKWSKEYGPIYSIKMVNMQGIVVSDHKVLKEMYLNDSAFTGRMDASAFDYYENGKCHGIVNTDGEHWEELRRFTLRQLRDFGFGKNSMESCIMEEVNELLETFQGQQGKPMSDIKDKFILAVVNSLWTIISGKRYKQDDPKLIRISRTMGESMDNMVETGPALMFAPWIRHIIPKLSGYSKFRKSINNFRDFFAQTVEEHKESYDDSFAKDFIDVALKQIKSTTDPKSAFYGELGERQLISTLADLFFGGSDTTAATLSWAILYLATFPEIQKKLQKEIESVTGQSRSCCIADRNNLPYAQAVLDEILRYSSLAPVGIQHRAIFDKVFHGYFIPKDSIIFSDLYFIHRNPEIWGDPQNFRPERFLSPDGKTFKKHEALIPFLVGRRQCIAETLARDTLFLFLTNTIQKFNVKFDTTKEKPTLEPAIGFLLNPKPYEVIFEERV